MQVVCDATQSPVVEETVISLQILAKIASCYYHHLLNYMANAIMPVKKRHYSSMLFNYNNFLFYFLDYV